MLFEIASPVLETTKARMQIVLHIRELALDCR